MQQNLFDFDGLNAQVVFLKQELLSIHARIKTFLKTANIPGIVSVTLEESYNGCLKEKVVRRETHDEVYHIVIPPFTRDGAVVLDKDNNRFLVNVLERRHVWRDGDDLVFDISENERKESFTHLNGSVCQVPLKFRDEQDPKKRVTTQFNGFNNGACILTKDKTSSPEAIIRSTKELVATALDFLAEQVFPNTSPDDATAPLFTSVSDAFRRSKRGCFLASKKTRSNLSVIHHNTVTPETCEKVVGTSRELVQQVSSLFSQPFRPIDSLLDITQTFPEVVHYLRTRPSYCSMLKENVVLATKNLALQQQISRLGDDPSNHCSPREIAVTTTTLPHRATILAFAPTKHEHFVLLPKPAANIKIIRQYTVVHLLHPPGPDTPTLTFPSSLRAVVQQHKLYLECDGEHAFIYRLCQACNQNTLVLNDTRVNAVDMLFPLPTKNSALPQYLAKSSEPHELTQRELREMHTTQTDLGTVFVFVQPGMHNKTCQEVLLGNYHFFWTQVEVVGRRVLLHVIYHPGKIIRYTHTIYSDENTKYTLVVYDIAAKNGNTRA